MGEQMRRMRWVLILAVVMTTLMPTAAGAQGMEVDPIDIAVRMADFPPVAGFRFVPENSSYEDLPDGSGRVLRTMFVSGDGASLMAVQQRIWRVNPPIDAGEELRIDRAQKLRSEGWTPAQEGSNTDTMSALVRPGPRGAVMYQVGFASGDIVAWSTMIGDSSIVSFGDALSMARLSAARLDTARSRSR